MTEPLFIIDSHLDIAWNAGIGRDFLEPVAVTHARPDGTGTFGTRVISLPDLLHSPVRLVIATIFVLPERAAGQWEGPNYRTPDEAYRLGQLQVEYYHGLAERDPRITLIKTGAALDRFVAEIEASRGQLEKIGLILSMEGADPVRQPAELAGWVDQGLRLLGPAWKATPYCGGTGEPGPLTPLGYELLAEMSRHKLVLDVSHMAEESFYNALDSWTGPLIASHSNCRHFVRTDRQLTDDMIRRLTQREAVIGVVPYDSFLVGKNCEGWPIRKATVEDVADQVLRICDLAGNTRQVALGTDWDGGFGLESLPQLLTGPQDLPLLGEVLLRRGFDEAGVQGFFYGNWLRVLRQALHNFD